MKSASHPNGLWTELILCLPAEVDFDRLANLEACRRPLNFLRLLARYPHMINTMIWEGHTIPLPEQFEDDTMPFDAVMLVKPYCFDPQGSSFDFDGHRIYFHQLVFLKEDEVAFKLKYGFEKLMDLANDQDRLDELLIFDPARLELSL